MSNLYSIYFYRSKCAETFFLNELPFFYISCIEIFFLQHNELKLTENIGK